MSQGHEELTIQSAESFLKTVTATTTTHSQVVETTSAQRKEVRSTTRTSRRFGATADVAATQAPAAVEAAPAAVPQAQVAGSPARAVSAKVEPEPEAAPPAAVVVVSPAAPPASPVAAEQPDASAPSKVLRQVDAIVEPVIAVLPARMQPYAQQVLGAAKPYFEQTVETVLPYANRAAATAEPLIAATKENIQAISAKTKDNVVAGAQPLVQRLQPYVDATVEQAAKARTMTSDVIGSTKERVQSTSDALAAAKAQAGVKKDEYVTLGKGTVRSYFEKLAALAQPYVALSKGRLAAARAVPQEAYVATKEYVADKKEALVQLSQAGATRTAEIVKAKTQPLVEKAEPLVRATTDRAAAVAELASSSYGAAVLKSSSAKTSAMSFVDVQRLRLNSAKQRVIDALVPQEAADPAPYANATATADGQLQDGGDKKPPAPRIVRFASLALAALANLTRLAVGTVAESERAQGAARTWETAKQRVAEDSRLQRLRSLASPYAAACVSAAGTAARKTSAAFSLVGKPLRAGTA